jgi:sirohydrochlorin ferrochelatase
VKRAILLVDHGSRRDEANTQLEQLAALVSERVPETIVRFAHMELAEPDIAAGVAACVAAGADELVVHPYFIAGGNHSTYDIPKLLRAAAAHHPGLEIRISQPLGLHPKLVDVVLDRVESATTNP